MTLLERFPRLRFAVTPGIVGRMFRAFASAGRRLDAENVALDSLVEARKTNRRMHFDVPGTINIFVRNTEPNGNVPFYAQNPLNGIGFGVGERVVQYDPVSDTGLGPIEIVGWSIILPDFNYVFFQGVTFELWYNGGGVAKAAVVWVTDFTFDSFQSIFAAVTIDPAFPVFVRISAESGVVPQPRSSTSAVCTAVLHFRQVSIS